MYMYIKILYIYYKDNNLTRLRLENFISPKDNGIKVDLILNLHR